MKHIQSIHKALAASIAAVALLASASASAQTITTTSATNTINGQSQPTIRPGALYESGDLTVGDSGQGVAELQGMLAELGYLTMPANATPGYFGPLTANALARFQQALGAPSTGYFGPMTRTAFALYYWNNPTFNQTYPSAQSLVSTTTSTGTNPVNGMINAIGADGTVYNGSWRYDARANQWMNMTNNTSSGPSIMNGSGYWYNGSWYNTDPNIRTGFDASSSSNARTSTNSSTDSSSSSTNVNSTSNTNTNMNSGGSNSNSGSGSSNSNGSSSSNTSLENSVLNTSN